MISAVLTIIVFLLMIKLGITADAAGIDEQRARTGN